MSGLSRRDLLRGRGLRSLLAPVREALDPAARGPGGSERGSRSTPPGPIARVGGPRADRPIPVLRPPGAIEERAFLEGCTRCGDCIDACPHDAITLAPARLRTAAGTPIVDPVASPCVLCEDRPCATACEAGVLDALLPAAMGTARILTQTCLAHQGGTCTTCHERCPVPGAIVVEAGRPRIVDDACVGCGVCQHVCPAPEPAILLMPAFARPPRPEAGEEATP